MELENILKQSLDTIMSDRFGRYSKYIIQDRALPDVRDGLKPVQRRILFSMHELGLFHNRSFKKSARVVGEVIGKYHPHGDSSIYEAMVRLSQDWKMNVPLIEMHGNNGSIDDDPAAAMRYTEARLAKISATLLDNIKKDTVLFAPNFDDSEKEPTVLPGLFPNLLVNGAKGIAAGYATEMPPHNLDEIVDALIAKIKSPNMHLSTLNSIVKGPDFPTGGILQGKQGIFEAFERGKGKVIIRSKYEIDDQKTKPSIRISEIPYGVIKSKLVRDIDEIRFNNKIDGIKEVRDESDRNGISIMIELTSGTNPEPVLNYLLSKTELQVYYNYNNVGIKDKAPKLMGLMEMLDAYLNHQREVQTSAIKFDLAKDEKRLEIVEGLIKVAQIADQVIDTIRKAEGSKQGVVNDLMNKFAFTELQANAIADLRLYRLSRTDQSIYLDEKKELDKRIEWSKNVLNVPEEFNKYLINLLKDLKENYATPRRTVIEGEMETISIDMEALIKHEDVWVGISRDGYIKRFSNRAYEANQISDYEVKEGDSLIYLDLINTGDKLLAFTNKGNYYYIPVHKIQEVKFKDAGKHLNDFAAIPIDEKIIEVICVEDFSIPCYVVLASKQGKAKRTPIKDFEVTRHTKTYTAMKISGDDELVGAKLSNGFNQVVIVNNFGKGVKYSETQLSTQGARSAGVRAMNLSSDGYVSSFAVANNDDVLGMISNRGGVKRIRVSSIMPMSKTTQGKHVYRQIKGNPHVTIDMNVVEPSTKIIFTKENVQEVEFKNADITSIEEGFSLIGPSQARNAKIFLFNKVSKKNTKLEKPEGQNDDDTFVKAEKAIDELPQMSLDEILKNL